MPRDVSSFPIILEMARGEPTDVRWVLPTAVSASACMRLCRLGGAAAPAIAEGHPTRRGHRLGSTCGPLRSLSWLSRWTASHFR